MSKVAPSDDSARLRPGDAQQLERLYAQHADPLLKFFTRRTLDPEAAADLVSDTFASLTLTVAAGPAAEPVSDSVVRNVATRQLARFLRGSARERRTTDRYGVQVPEDVEDA